MGCLMVYRLPNLRGGQGNCRFPVLNFNQKRQPCDNNAAATADFGNNECWANNQISIMLLFIGFGKEFLNLCYYLKISGKTF
jgi:hypothetical protein